MEVYQDIPRLYTAIAEWCACLTYIHLVNGTEWIRKDRKKLIATIFFPVIQGAFLVSTSIWHNILWIICMLIAVGFMLIFLWYHLDGRFLEAVGCLSGAFILAEFAASLEWQTYNYLERLEFGNIYTNIGCLIFIYLLVFISGYKLEKRIITKEYLGYMTRKEVMVTAGVSVITFAFSNLSFFNSGTLFSGGVYFDIFIIRTLVDGLGLAVLFGLDSQFREFHVREELQEIQKLYLSQYERYRSYQDSLEVFHMKYHDLKHQLAGLRAEHNPEKREARINQMESELDYLQIVDPTGNQVLDALLDSNRIRIIKNQIKITCVVDGALLDFIHVMDICTIFGNAIDNALENVIQIENPEKRLIHLTVSAKKNFVYIAVENYCETKPVPDEHHFFRTTKADKENHGYGLRSIRYSVEKYGGTVTAELNNNWFELHILIPKPI